MKNKFSLVLILIFCCTLLGYQYYNNNLDKILCSKADGYYYKNNIAKAQEYYEKAFEKGCNESRKRLNYVKSIINSPITVKSQEKLTKFLEINIDDAANLDAKYFLEDIKREIYKKYYGNYITNAVLNHQIIRWGNRPITFEFINSDQAPEYFVEEIKNAFQEWESATDKEIQFVEIDNSANIIINFSKNNPADDFDKKYVVAYTVPEIELDKLNKMEIKFYLKDIEGNYFSQNQVYNTALHEIAHAIGFMGHCTDRESIMYLAKDSKSVINDSREALTDADIQTMKLLYKIKPQITNVEDLNSQYIPSLALGSQEEIGEEKLEEAMTYVQSAPELPAGYIDLAENYLLKKDYPNAIKNLKIALRLAETSDIKAMVYYNLAVVYFYSNEIENSKKYLSNSMAINNSDEKQYLLAEILVKQGKSKEAIGEYQKLVQKNPNNIEYAISLINLYLNQKDFLNARKALKNYIKNNPSDKNNPRFSTYGFIKIGL